MTHTRTKLALGGAALVASVAYLVVAGVQSGWVYFLPVDAFLADGKYQQQRVRLCGKVSDQQLEVDSAGLAARFYLLGETQKVRVAYSGVIPDMFKPGVEAVVEGRLSDEGIFNATVLMTKCASKYEQDPAGSSPANQRPAEHPPVAEVPT